MDALHTAATRSAVSARRLSGLIPVHELSGYRLSQLPRFDRRLYLFATYYAALRMDGPQWPACGRNQLTLAYDSRAHRFGRCRGRRQEPLGPLTTGWLDPPCYTEARFTADYISL